MIDLKQEKLEEMRQDMIFEQKLRSDYDFAFEYVSEKYNLYDKVASIRNAVQELQLLGYDVKECDIIKEI